MPKCDFNKVALLCNFIEITHQHGCSPVNLLRIFRTPFQQNTSESLLLTVLVLRWNFILFDISPLLKYIVTARYLSMQNFIDTATELEPTTI